MRIERYQSVLKNYHFSPKSVIVLIKSSILELGHVQEKFPKADLSVSWRILNRALLDTTRIEQSSNWDCEKVLTNLRQAMVLAGHAVTAALAEEVRASIRRMKDSRKAEMYKASLEEILSEACDNNVARTHESLTQLKSWVRQEAPICSSLGDALRAKGMSLVLA